MKRKTYICNTLIVGSGCAAFNAADSLYDEGQKNIRIVTEGIRMGTSRNTGSDKQTYYKLSMAGNTEDSVYKMAKNLYEGQAVNGDTCLIEAALSPRCFFKLVNKGVPFPCDGFGQYVGYKTDHDPMQRATSCGPLTSRYMTECLEHSVMEKKIPVTDRVRIIRLLIREEQGERRVYGAVGLDEEGISIFYCENIIYATGGPSGLYYNSVYPASQTCAHGAAILAGASLSNAAEWQYGIASVGFRWNLSGTYQQVIPSYISTDPEGNDEREFLGEYFADSGQMLTAIFLKGYQWPFDPRKVGRGGSSLVDIAVYFEEYVKGRKVYLDFRKNPEVAGKNGSFDFSLLSPEAYEYLEKSGVLMGTPIERLRKMNNKAYELYRTHGIDLEKNRLQISVCAQHNNGGLYADRWWQSNLKHLFPVGEVCGNFGVYRPGGTALNATQVGSLRAAQFIAEKYTGDPDEKEAKKFAEDDIREVETLLGKLLTNEKKIKKWEKPMEFRRRIEKEMDACAAFLRDKKEIQKMMDRCRERLTCFWENATAATQKELKAVWINYDILVTQYVYLGTMLQYIEEGGKSRGSYLIRDDADFSQIREHGVQVRLDNGERKEWIQISRLTDGWPETENRKRNSLPEAEAWFETVYKEFNEHQIIGK